MVLIINILKPFLWRKEVDCLPIYGLCILNSFHRICNSNGLFSDHNGEFVGELIFTIVDSKHLIFEDSLVILITKDDVWANIIVGMLTDVLEDSRIDECNHVLWLYIWKLLITLYFILFVESQSEQTSQIRSY